MPGSSANPAKSYYAELNDSHTMCSKVLILSASPRKNGNTDLLCDRFAEGAKDAGNDVVKVRVAEKRIGFCTGCEKCIGSGRCVIRDDMDGIAKLMLESDVIVFSSPVYFYTVDAQMKALIDRCVPFYADMTGKRVYFITAAADPNDHMLDLTLECFRGFTRDCLPDAEECGSIKAAGIMRKGEVAGTAYMDRAYEMGRSVE